MRTLVVEVVDLHVRLTFGQILMHSEQYSTAGNARRAGKSLAAAIVGRPVVLRYELRGKPVVEQVRCTEQPSLFDDVAHARGSHPVTSHEAAASIPSDKIRASQEAVLRVLRLVGPCHNDALVACYRGQQPVLGLPVQSDQSIRSRRSELTVRGLVVDSGERFVLESGRKSIVWAATS